ncbi:MAG: hypothetical protein HZC40_11825 [Chloroflexi bacterium]|nr:hypothetical protein [Chloroflexota bacterium]
MSNQPIRKTQARVVERERARARRQAEQRDLLSRSLPFVIGAAVVLFAIVVAIFVATNQTPSNAGGARLQVDREQIEAH